MTAEEAKKLSDDAQNRELESKNKRLEKFKNSKRMTKIIRRMDKLIAKSIKNTFNDDDRAFFYPIRDLRTDNLRTLSKDELEYAKNEILSHYKNKGFVAYIYTNYDYSEDIVISWKI